MLNSILPHTLSGHWSNNLSLITQLLQLLQIPLLEIFLAISLTLQKSPVFLKKTFEINQTIRTKYCNINYITIN